MDDKLCGTCEEGGDSTVASFWCRDCTEPLCDNCRKYHRLMKVSRRHTIEEMDAIRRHPKQILSVPQACPDHVGKDIELFCADHNTLCCVMCVATEHRRCEKVASVDKLAKQLEEGVVTEELVDKLNSYLDHLKSMKKDREGNCNALSNKKNEIKEQIAAYKKNVNIVFEKLENTMTRAFDKEHKEQTTKLTSHVDWCDAMRSAVENAKVVLQMTSQHCSNAQVFVTVQQCIERSIKYEDDMAKEQNDKFEHIDYSFEIDSAFEAFLHSLVNVESFGKVHTHFRRSFIPSSPGLKLFRDRCAEKEIEIDCKTPSDTRNCCLSSVLILSDRRLLIADQNNQKIKLFKDDGALIYEHPFTTWPRDLTELDNNRIAVTLPKERKIDIFYLGDKLKSLESLRLQHECWGITFNSNLIVGCIGQDYGCLKFLTLDGVEIDAIENDANDRRLFIKTNYVTTSVDGSEIYVTDRTKDTMVALALKRPEQKPQLQAEDQGPKHVVRPRLRQRPSTVLDSTRGDGANGGPNKQELSKTLPLPGNFSRSQSSKTFRETASSPIDPTGGTFDERLEHSFDRRAKNTPHPDRKRSSQDDRGSLKTEYLDVMPRASPIERVDTASSLSDPDQEDKVDYDVLYSYSNDTLRSAGGVTVDQQGNIYVSGYRSSNIHQVSPGGSLIKILLQDLSQPLAVTMEPYGERLAVTETTSARQNFLQIYKLI